MATDATANEPFLVRPMHPRECEEVASLFERTLLGLQYYNARAKEEELRKYGVDQLLLMHRDDPLAVLVARTTQEVIGFCLSRYDDGVIWLSWFGTATERRCDGVATQLLQHLERGVRTRRCHKIWCDTRVENLESARVLARMGYQNLVLLKNHWYGQDFYLWEKSVTP